MPNLVGTGNNQVPTNAMLGGLAYQSPEHVNLTDVEIENIAAIKAKLNENARDIFVYDTRNDSDGGAWRKKTVGQSWYNEPLGTQYRGYRREFPSVAVIITTTTGVTLYDGDDPNLPLWMKFPQDSTGPIYAIPDKVFALNGTLCVSAATGSSSAYFTELAFIHDAMRLHQGTAINQTRSGWQHGMYPRTDGGSWLGSQSPIHVNSSLVDRNTNDVSMTIHPLADLDPTTGMPKPTIVIGTDSGTRIIHNGTVTLAGTSTHDMDDVGVSEDAVIMRNKTNGGYYWYDYSGTNFGNFFSNTGNLRILKNPTSSAENHLAWTTRDEKLIIGQDNGLNIIFGTIGAKSGIPDQMAAFIASDYNTGWHLANSTGIWCSATDTLGTLHPTNLALTATAGSTARLTSETYDSGDTSWQMVDNAGNNNGYVVVEFQNLTVNQAYKITITFDNNAALDSGYNHHISHDNGGAAENHTYFTHWNKTNGSSETLTGYFVAQTASADDFVIYANGITLNVSDFSCVETNDIFEKEYLLNGDFTDGTTSWAIVDSNEGSFSVSSNQLTLNNSTSADPPVCCAQAVPGLQAGEWYNVYCDKASGHDTVVNIVNASTAGGGSGSYGNVVYNNANEGRTCSIEGSSTTNVCILRVNTNTTGTSVLNSVSIRRADVDRSMLQQFLRDRVSALSIFGTMTRTPVATGAELLGYTGWSDSNYLYQPHNANLNFGGDFSCVGWVKWDDPSATGFIFDRAQVSDGSSRYCVYQGSNKIGFYTSTGSADSEVLAAINNYTDWMHFACLRHNSGLMEIYINGEQIVSTSLTKRAVDTSSNAPLVVGNRYSITDSNKMKGSIALLRFASIVPSAAYIKKMYDDEKLMFEPNAKCSLYGTSDTVKGVYYDESTRRLHVGTSAGRSDFNGLCRINNTTTPVTTVISASGGLIVEQ